MLAEAQRPLTQAPPVGSQPTSTFKPVKAALVVCLLVPAEDAALLGTDLGDELEALYAVRVVRPMRSVDHRVRFASPARVDGVLIVANRSVAHSACSTKKFR